MSTRKNTGCPKGYIMRKGYTRKFRESLTRSGYTVRRKGKVFTVHPTVHSVHIGEKCIIDRTHTNDGIGKLRKGDLFKYGYQYRLSDRLREKALKNAVKAYGALSVYRKLDAVSKLSVRSAPDASKIFSRDREWIMANFEIKRK